MGTDLVSSDLARAAAEPGAARPVVEALHGFGAALWRRVADQPGNVVISPYSVATALAMTVNGAVGPTRSEMLAVLGLGLGPLNAGVNALTLDVEAQAGPSVVAAAANQLFGQRGARWERDFLDVLAEDYGAGLRLVDYVADAEAARSAVNIWTAGRTHGRIEQILPPGSVDALTRLVLVNTLYLKAAWLTPFTRESTSDRAFHRADGTTVTVPVMRGQPAGAALGHGDGWTAVRLPYTGAGLAMTIVLPDLGRSLPIGDLPAVLASVEPAALELSLPRFTFRTARALRQPLVDLGMSAAFSEAADFSAMTADEPLRLSDVFHQVYVAVDEEGTEAAAATAVVARVTSAMVTRAEVVVDRPFGFVVHDVEHGAPLFLGRVDDPRA